MQSLTKIASDRSAQLYVDFFNQPLIFSLVLLISISSVILLNAITKASLLRLFMRVFFCCFDIVLAILITVSCIPFSFLSLYYLIDGLQSLFNHLASLFGYLLERMIDLLSSPYPTSS
ncbi:hypothetical protein [Candidatus Similichlamydia epinepheli]|uniref:hypothetical protein n=1 Tax=Candidatus Similichlamydia epinepheli TaxID=1903953 RepID=UPI000D3B4E76|nr:hypothetical protein [Candidatus Similichlamydia epinepheli]